MQIPSYGAAPLSATFLAVRVMQLIAMISIIGMTSNFVNDIVVNMQEVPKEVVGTLSVTCIATLYTLVSIAFYWASAQIGLFVMCAVDSLLLIAWIVVATTFGKPVSYLNCYAIHNANGDPLKYAFAVEQSVKSVSYLLARALGSEKFNFYNLAAHTTRARCFETKAIWGLSIALCLLFTTSVALLPTLFFKHKKAMNIEAKVQV